MEGLLVGERGHDLLCSVEGGLVVGRVGGGETESQKHSV